MNILIHSNGQDHGPYSIEQIKEFLADGTLQESDHAWYDGCDEWMTVADAINQDQQQSQIPPKADQSNTTR